MEDPPALSAPHAHSRLITSQQGPCSSYAPDAQRVTHHYASGNHVPVHYEPADPSVSCLEVGNAGIASYVLALGGVALTVIAA
ncbi:DUF3592 domain-containing protein [Pyxidicoccus sp. MSG2]|uniref:DUF3592 domain-containing protein n=1 Tax=Pyxidicoccus sp. MSG2 TaxID=2996790 RepID=UPI0022720D2C|nr:hypothetical protein [Pyxidicoccus sp. MSG2]MCY1017703.1 hypothetical protein [Pyxidicoccus sp. MSG2]